MRRRKWEGGKGDKERGKEGRKGEGERREGGKGGCGRDGGKKRRKR